MNNYNLVGFAENGIDAVAADDNQSSITLKEVATVGHSSANGNKAYGTIERAFAENGSASQIWVLPDTTGKVVIKGDINILSGQTLILPYGTGNSDRNSDGKNNSGAVQKKVTHAIKDPNKRITQVVLEGKITVASGGLLEVNGVMCGGANGSNISGGTSGSFAELVIRRDAQVICNGEIRASGYITADYQNYVPDDDHPSILINSGGKIYQPFILRDYQSGNYFAAIGHNKTEALGGSHDAMKELGMLPFSEFTFYNVQPFMKINYGGMMNVWANLDTSYGAQHTDATFIGVAGNTEHFVQLISGGYMTTQIDPDTEIATVNFYGGMSLGAFELNMTLLIFPVSASTVDAFFPLCWAYDITLNNGTYDFGTQKIKLMWGSKLTVADDATLDAGDAIIQIYDEYDYNALKTAIETSTNGKNAVLIYGRNQNFNKYGKLTVNGNLTVGSLGGKIYSNTPGAKVTINNSSSATSYEAVRYTADTFSSVLNHIQTITNTTILVNESSTTDGTTGTYWYNGKNWTSDANVTINYEYVDADSNTVTGEGWKANDSLAVAGLGKFSETMITLPVPNGANVVIGWYFKTEDGKFIDANRIMGTEVSLEYLLSNLSSTNGNFTIYCLIENPYKDFTFNYGGQYGVANEEIRYADDQLGYNALRWASEFDFDKEYTKYHSGWTIEIGETTITIERRYNATTKAFDIYVDGVKDAEFSLKSLLTKLPTGTSEVELQAVWSDKAIVEIDYGENSIGLGTETVYLNIAYGQNTHELENVRESDMDVFVNKYFAGWTNDSNGSVSLVNGVNVLTVSGNTKITANWNDKYVLTINYGKNSIGLPEVSYIYLNVDNGQVTYTLPNVYMGDENQDCSKYYAGYTVDNCTWNISTLVAKITDTSKPAEITFSWNNKASITIIYGSNSYSIPTSETYYLGKNQTSFDNSYYIRNINGSYIIKEYITWTVTGADNLIVDSNGMINGIPSGANIIAQATWNNKVLVTLDTSNSATYTDSSGTAITEAIYLAPGDHRFTVGGVSTDNDINPKVSYYYSWNSSNSSYVTIKSGTTTSVTINVKAGASADTAATVSPWSTKLTIKVSISNTGDSSNGDDEHTIKASEYTIYIRSSASSTLYGQYYYLNEDTLWGPITENYYIVPGHQFKFDVTRYKYSNLPTDWTSTDAIPADGYSIQHNPDGCFAAGTLVTLADGTVKKIEDVLPTDILVVFDHETGKFVEAEIMLIETHGGWDYYDIINVTFSNGITTRIINEHGFFNKTLNKYVYITEYNYTEFIGHEFIVTDGETISTTTLVDVTITNEYTGIYNIVTKYHLNCITDGLLSMSGGIDGIFNIFEYGEDLKYDEEKMQADIEEYGLYTYEDFAEYVSEDVYNMFPAQYFKVAVGKGHITYEEILALVEEYLVKHGYVNPDSFQ